MNSPTTLDDILPFWKPVGTGAFRWKFNPDHFKDFDQLKPFVRKKPLIEVLTTNPADRPLWIQIRSERLSTLIDGGWENARIQNVEGLIKTIEFNLLKEVEFVTNQCRQIETLLDKMSDKDILFLVGLLAPHFPDT